MDRARTLPLRRPDRGPTTLALRAEPFDSFELVIPAAPGDRHRTVVRVDYYRPDQVAAAIASGGLHRTAGNGTNVVYRIFHERDSSGGLAATAT